jgi:hypothetical protein
VARRRAPKAAKANADRLFSKIVRSHGECEHCGATPDQVQLQCAHWISRRYAWTRTHGSNAFCLCAKCHRWFTDHPTEFSRWAIRQRGEDVYQQILIRSQRRDKFDWFAEEARLKAEWKAAEHV